MCATLEPASWPGRRRQIARSPDPGALSVAEEQLAKHEISYDEGELYSDLAQRSAAAGHPGPAGVPVSKVSPESVHLRQASENGYRRCANCTMWLPMTEQCTHVAGEDGSIRRSMVCDDFELLMSLQADGSPMVSPYD